MAALSWASAFLRDWLRFMVYILYCVEGGLFLILAPWSSLWEKNFFYIKFAVLESLALQPATRGIVSGLGAALLLHGVAGVVEAARLGRRSNADGPIA